jgi:hypothetical protein
VKRLRVLIPLVLALALVSAKPSTCQVTCESNCPNNAASISCSGQVCTASAGTVTCTTCFLWSGGYCVQYSIEYVNCPAPDEFGGPDGNT